MLAFIEHCSETVVSGLARRVYVRRKAKKSAISYCQSRSPSKAGGGFAPRRLVAVIVLQFVRHTRSAEQCLPQTRYPVPIIGRLSAKLEQEVAVQIRMPAVTKRSLSVRAAETGEPMRVIVLRALADAGIQVPEHELLGRRKPGRRIAKGV
jgi:hypothetical protein